MSEPGYSVSASGFSGENEGRIILLEQIIEKLDEEEIEKQNELEILSENFRSEQLKKWRIWKNCQDSSKERAKDRRIKCRSNIFPTSHYMKRRNWSNETRIRSGRKWKTENFGTTAIWLYQLFEDWYWKMLFYVKQ